MVCSTCSSPRTDGACSIAIAAASSMRSRRVSASKASTMPSAPPGEMRTTMVTWISSSPATSPTGTTRAPWISSTSTKAAAFGTCCRGRARSAPAERAAARDGATVAPSARAGRGGSAGEPRHGGAAAFSRRRADRNAARGHGRRVWLPEQRASALRALRWSTGRRRTVPGVARTSAPCAGRAAAAPRPALPARSPLRGTAAAIAGHPTRRPRCSGAPAPHRLPLRCGHRGCGG
jgi:hypothetical protein